MLLHACCNTENDNLPVALCGCETWSVILGEKRRLRVFECLVLRSVLGLRGEEVTVGTEECIGVKGGGGDGRY